MLSHDVALLAVAVGSVPSLAAGLVYDAETVPAVRLIRISHEVAASGIREFTGLDELHHVGGNGNRIVSMGVPYVREPFGNGLFQVVDVEATGGDTLLGHGLPVDERRRCFASILGQAALLVLLATAAGAGCRTHRRRNGKCRLEAG